jgi:TRAP-type C4-dicarboxylate transport system permease small subunit
MTIEALFQTLAKGTRSVSAVCLALSVFLFGASLAIMAAEIVLRYAFNHPLQNVGEAVIIAFIYVYLVGGAALYARNEDIALDYIFRKVGMKPQAIWLLIIYLAVAATMAVVLVETVMLIKIQQGVLTPALRLPLGIEHAALAVAAAVIFYASLVEAIGCWIWFRSGKRPAVFPSPGEGLFVH